MVTDTIADLLVRIKNGYLAKHKQVEMPATKLRESIVQVLVANGYVESFERVEQKPQDILKLTLRYVNGKAAMVDMKRVSTPGRRLYGTADKLPRVLGGYGMSVISTSQGVMTDKQARKSGLGGEILFRMW